ncbi:hypothetical protein E0H88_01930 [Acinetobacter sp. ANC 4216]|uniref:hypothetical protein n=1 Tax=Acinetobacter sp. ANC 4216 TaxID=2529840 RepID=UPI00103AD565|nr:hypothetical protein [Acinetobacter sp. ANC 4216]TCB72348.1 hypothetical protein E0H88_01930 [Acinetobacter sp. ANC 4216]
MKTIRTMLISTALLACTPLFANPTPNAASELKAKDSEQNTADKAENVNKEMNQTQTADENFVSKNSQHSTDSNGSHPSNMDINGKTHAELGIYSGRIYSGFTIKTPNQYEE